MYGEVGGRAGKSELVEIQLGQSPPIFAYMFRGTQHTQTQMKRNKGEKIKDFPGGPLALLGPCGTCLLGSPKAHKAHSKKRQRQHQHSDDDERTNQAPHDERTRLRHDDEPAS